MSELYEMLADPSQGDVMRRNAARLDRPAPAPAPTWRRYLTEYAATGIFVLGADGGAAVAFLSHERQGTSLSAHVCAALALTLAVYASGAASGGVCGVDRRLL